MAIRNFESGSLREVISERSERSRWTGHPKTPHHFEVEVMYAMSMPSMLVGTLGSGSGALLGGLAAPKKTVAHPRHLEASMKGLLM